nr:DNA topoisomerase III [Bacteroidaceae bacterium]
KLRGIEKKEYDAKLFLEELKEMVTEIVQKVLTSQARRITAVETDTKKTAEKGKKETTATTKKRAAGEKQKAASSKKGIVQPETTSAQIIASPSEQSKEAAPSTSTPSWREGDPCPLCGKGHILRGRNAFGCSEWKNGCTWRQTFS